MGSMAALNARIPIQTSINTVNRVCSSELLAVLVETQKVDFRFPGNALQVLSDGAAACTLFCHQTPRSPYRR